MKKNVKKIVLIVILAIVIVIGGIIIYDRATISKEYYISEKNINIPIFVYHDIVENENQIKFDYMQTTKKKFEEQISGLIKFGYKVITYDDLIAYKNGEKALTKRSCLVVFDDGYEGNYINAYPIAKKYNIPITIFVIDDRIEAKGYLKWSQIHELSDSGIVSINTHGKEHVEFDKLSMEEVKQNVIQAHNHLEQELGKKITKVFTYPYGLCTEDTINELEKEGFVQNLTDNKINKSKNLDLSRLHRCYPLDNSIYKMLLKVWYRSVRYN